MNSNLCLVSSLSRYPLYVIFVGKPNLPENYQETTWSKLREAVIAIQTSRAIAYSLEELYQAVENMCSHKVNTSFYENNQQTVLEKCMNTFAWWLTILIEKLCFTCRILFNKYSSRLLSWCSKDNEIKGGCMQVAWPTCIHKGQELILLYFWIFT